MARFKLIEYLNDPSLLVSTTMEELQSWAEEAPYSAIIRKLIAQKMTIEENTSSSEIEKANTLAVLSSANPDHTISSIEDFKSFILENGPSSEANEIVHIELPEKNDQQNLEEIAITDEEDPVQLISEVQEITEEIIELNLLSTSPSDEPQDDDSDAMEDISQIESVLQVDHEEETEGKEDEFYSWLETLKSVEQSSDADSPTLELEDKDLASEGLAELLINQGHYAKAIEMYRLLQLKNPQKSSFFAAQIEKLKAL